jgi:hypothetical protein
VTAGEDERGEERGDEAGGGAAAEVEEGKGVEDITMIRCNPGRNRNEDARSAATRRASGVAMRSASRQHIATGLRAQRHQRQGSDIKRPKRCYERGDPKLTLL